MSHICAKGGSCKGSHPLICRDYGCAVEQHRRYQFSQQPPSGGDLDRAAKLGDTLAAAQRCVDALDEVRRRPSLATTASFQLEADKAITAHTTALAAYFKTSAS